MTTSRISSSMSESSVSSASRHNKCQQPSLWPLIRELYFSSTSWCLVSILLAHQRYPLGWEATWEREGWFEPWIKYCPDIEVAMELLKSLRGTLGGFYQGFIHGWFGFWSNLRLICRYFCPASRVTLNQFVGHMPPCRGYSYSLDSFSIGGLICLCWRVESVVSGFSFGCRTSLTSDLRSLADNDGPMQETLKTKRWKKPHNKMNRHTYVRVIRILRSRTACLFSLQLQIHLSGRVDWGRWCRSLKRCTSPTLRFRRLLPEALKQVFMTIILMEFSQQD